MTLTKEELDQYTLEDLRLHDVDEVAELSGYEPYHIRKLCREEKLPAVKVGRAWKIKEIDVKRFLLGEFSSEDCAETESEEE